MKNLLEEISHHIQKQFLQHLGGPCEFNSRNQKKGETEKIKQHIQYTHIHILFTTHMIHPIASNINSMHFHLHSL